MRQAKSRKRKFSSTQCSLSYARVCEWEYSPINTSKLTDRELEEAKIHAIRLQDDYILGVIEELEKRNSRNDTTPTPKEFFAPLKPKRRLINRFPRVIQEIIVRRQTNR